MNKKNIILLLISISVISYCKEKNTTTKPIKTGVVVTDKACSYSYDANSTSVKWTAYKFNERVGVSGTFNDVKVEGTTTNSNPLQVIAKSSFTINTGSVNSKDGVRDKKITKSFFGAMKNTTSITGAITSIEDKYTGNAITKIKMNGVEKEVDLQYTLIDNVLTAKGKIEVADFSALSAITSLNKVCSELHKGKDGSSKLWPDVAIQISTTLKKTCN